MSKTKQTFTTVLTILMSNRKLKCAGSKKENNLEVNCKESCLHQNLHKFLVSSVALTEVLVQLMVTVVVVVEEEVFRAEQYPGCCKFCCQKSRIKKPPIFYLKARCSLLLRFQAIVITLETLFSF